MFIDNKKTLIFLGSVLLVIVWLETVAVALIAILPIYNRTGCLLVKPVNNAPPPVSAPIVETKDNISTSTPNVNRISGEEDEYNLGLKRRMIIMPKSLPKVKILITELGYLNVRSKPYIEAKIIERLEPGEIYEYRDVFSGWYEIVLSENEIGWVSGKYVEILE